MAKQMLLGSNLISEPTRHEQGSPLMLFVSSLLPHKILATQFIFTDLEEKLMLFEEICHSPYSL